MPFIRLAILLMLILVLGFNLIAQPLHPVVLTSKSKIEVSSDSLKWKDYPVAMQMISASKAIVLENAGTLALYDISTGRCLKKIDLTKLNYKPVYKELVILNNKPHYLSYDSIMKVRDTLPFCTISNFIFQEGDLIVPICLLNRYTGPLPWKQHQKKYNFSRFFAITTLDTSLNVKSTVATKLQYPPFEPMDNPGFNEGFYRERSQFGYIFLVRNLMTYLAKGRGRYAKKFLAFQMEANHYEELLTVQDIADTMEWKNERLFLKSHYYFLTDSVRRAGFTHQFFTDSYRIYKNDSVDKALKNIYRPDSALIGKFTVSKDNKCLYYILNEWDMKQQKFIGSLVKYDVVKQKSIGLYPFSTVPCFTSLDFIDNKLIYITWRDNSYYFTTLDLP